ncbi:glucan biosynthesis protein [Beijerinckia mobilis]|uniref:glucan biosynthesis protein n=1 Tax=Beijerinckia mobilis TaxID=231434 RepID=UPI00068EDD47|nr:glucan biosynthesis protein [Beijerinckia mobilis]
MNLTRRTLLGTGMASGLSWTIGALSEAAADSVPGAITLGAPKAFSYAALRERARRAARLPYKELAETNSAILDALDYDAVGAIQHPVENALFASGPGAYRATFFHLGRLQRKPVRINVVTGSQTRPVLYNPHLFTMPAQSPARNLPADTGFAGFRLHKPADYPDGDSLGDFFAFLGASYFRASGPLSQYGLSARGLAIDVAPAPGSQEEFPSFTQFWIEPRKSLPPLIYAWLEGPSVVGVYRFDTSLAPKRTLIDVTLTLHLRKSIARLGLAPLTSMYWFSERRKESSADWRPEVHDSDGLALWTQDGHHIWRPLDNPATVRVSSFPGSGLRGFGLIQRDRDVQHYLDAVHFERRPNLWIEPKGPWPEGTVELVEIPTQSEYNDNIVAFFRPSAPARAGQTHHLRYRAHWIATEPHPSDLCRCTATRLARPMHYRDDEPEFHQWIVVDFEGEALASLTDITPHVTASSGTLESIDFESVPGRSQAARVRFAIRLAERKTSDLSITLTRNGKPVSETWLFTLDPAEDSEKPATVQASHVNPASKTIE